MLRVALGGRGCSIPVGIGSDARNGLCFGGCSELHSEVSVGSIPVGIGSNTRNGDYVWEVLRVALGGKCGFNPCWDWEWGIGEYGEICRV